METYPRAGAEDSLHKIHEQTGSVGDACSEQTRAWDLALADGAAVFLTAVNTVGDVFSKLEQGVCTLYNHLARFGEFQELLAVAARSQPSTVQPWGWHPLVETEALRAGLLVVYRFGRIPLHDHPGAHGAQRVIAGRVRIQQFEEQPRFKPSGSLRSLKLTVDRELGEGGTASFAPDRRNVHGLETVWPRAVLLTATALPHREGERAWYYPVPLRPPDRSSILVNCVRRRPTVDHLKANRGRGSKSGFLKE